MRTLDLETTGLCGRNDEILDVAIIGDNGEVLLNSLVKPARHTDWPAAQAIHGITPAMVQEAPTYAELEPTITALLKDQDVVIYNAAFDSQFLETPLQTAASIHCCMLRFSDFIGDWNEYYGNNRWQRLSRAIKYIGYTPVGDLHRAQTDALATHHVWQFLTDDVVHARVEQQRRDKANTIKAGYVLTGMISQQSRIHDKYREFVTEFLEVWWLRKARCPGHWAREDYDYENSLAQIFYGKSLHCVWLEDKFDGNVYMKKNDIPENLVPASWFPKEVWLQELLQPCAAFVGKKTGWPLYDRKCLDEIKTQYPTRFYRGIPNGCQLATRPRLRELGYTAADIRALEVHQERQNGFNQLWYPLYAIELSEIKRRENELCT